MAVDRPLDHHVLRALKFEWGNPSCWVPVLRALIGDCSFRSAKNNPQGGERKDEKHRNRHWQGKLHSMRNGRQGRRVGDDIIQEHAGRRKGVYTQDEKRIRRERTMPGRVRVDCKHVAQDV